MLKSAVCLLALLASNAHSSILPENNLEIPVSQKNAGLSEADYSFVIDKFEAVYRPIVEALGKKLIINRLWENPRVNAGTLRRNNEWIINLYGGYARHPLVTKDGFALVICHELGHHLAGPPKKTFQNGKGWPSVEGQADYYATLDCMKKVLPEIAGSVEEENSAITELCITEESPNACRRVLAAGLSVGAISADLRNREIPDYRTPDPSIVTVTFEDHPVPQCRLDTYLAGVKKGERPRCWFAQK